MCMNKKMDKKRFFKKIITLVAAGLIVGCAASPKPEPSRTALGKWHSQNINADGSKADWPGSAPQYKDSEIDTKIWISNNAEQLCLLAEVNDPGIARQLTQNGLILSMETGEKNAKPFSIQLKCHASFKLPDTLVVTYPFSSGPVTMSMTEARTTGIALGLTEAGRHTLIFEAVISLDAIFFDVPRIAGAVMNIALSAKSNSFAIKRRENLEGKKHDRPKGESPDQGSSDTSHGPGKPDDMKQTKASDDPFRAAVEITLAGPAK